MDFLSLNKRILFFACFLFEYFVLYWIFIFFFVSDETAKWEKITYLGIVSCTGLAVYILSKGHHHYDEPPVSFPLYGIWFFLIPFLLKFHCKNFMFLFFHEHSWILLRDGHIFSTRFMLLLLWYVIIFSLPHFKCILNLSDLLFF